jgi:hypothetical protein
MKIIRIVGIAALLSAFLFIFDSCTKNFEEINTDPNNAGLDKASPDMLLTNALESLTDRVQEIFLGEEMGNCWVQHQAKVQYTDEDRYIYRESVVNASWTSFYAANGNDVATLYNTAILKNNDNYKGIALVLKVYIASLLTDLWGPVPYFQAWKGASFTLAAYDSQESIYRDIIAKLDTANALLNPAGLAIGGDILYNNDISKWKKFANSLKLRLLLRMSARDKAFATTEMGKIIADPGTYPIFESNADNAALQYLGAAPNNNPWNENRKTRDDHRVSKTLTDQMWTNSPYVDWRVAIYADVDGNTTYEGMPNGLTSADAASYNGNGIKFTCKVGSFFTEATCPGMLMSFAELKFILAEAALSENGFIPGGDVQAGVYYIEGIVGSYAQYGDRLVQAVNESPALPAISADWNSDSLAYDFIAKDVWGWDASKAKELIGTQRWAACFDQGLQASIEWRRTGWPALSPAVAASPPGQQIPLRYPYPTNERATNPTSLDAGIALLGGPDNLNTPLWWDVIHGGK